MFLILFFIINNLLYANQIEINNQKYNHSLFIELAGQGPFVSINYEKFIFNNKGIARFGVGGIVTILNSYLTYPISCNYLINKNFEIGLGVTPWLSTYDNLKQFGKKNNKLHPNIWMGYRYNKNKKLFKIGFATYIQDLNKFTIVPGISLGTSF